MTALPQSSRVLGLAILACGVLLLSPALALAQATDPEPSSPPTIPPPPPTPITPAPEPPTTQPSQTMPQGDLPEASKLLDQAIEAMGGKEALAEIKTTSLSATGEAPMGGSVNLILKNGENGQFYIESTVPGMPTASMGSNGEVGWSSHPMAGYQLLSDEETKMVREQSNMFNVVHRMREEFPEMTTMEKADFQGKPAWKVKLIDKEGNEHLAFFDPETHLMRGMQRNDGPMEIVIALEDWIERDNVKVFTTMKIEQMGQLMMTMKMDEIEFNTLEASDFELPEEVKAMVEQRKGGGGGAQPGAATRPATQPMSSSLDLDEVKRLAKKACEPDEGFEASVDVSATADVVTVHVIEIMDKVSGKDFAETSTKQAMVREFLEKDLRPLIGHRKLEVVFQ